MGQFRRNLLFLSISGKKDSNYLTIEALEDGLTVRFDKSGLSYRIDSGDWVEIGAGVKTPSVNSGQTVSFKGEITNDASTYGKFTISKKCNLSGNCMSIIYGDDFRGQTSVPDYAFYYLFQNCTNIVSVSKGFLPATELGENCYGNMFRGCSSLVDAPELPAITLSNSCYYEMFRGCSSLVQAPELPAMALVDSCYYAMFYGCSGLVQTPELPATTLSNNCYNYMFRDCKSLSEAPALPAIELATNCYYRMFLGCTNLTSVPELPALALVSGCYYRMFYGCTKLNYIKAMFMTTPSTNYTNGWVTNVSSTGTFVKNKDAVWNVTGVNGIPSGWTVIT